MPSPAVGLPPHALTSSRYEIENRGRAERARIELARASLPHPASNQVPSPAFGLPPRMYTPVPTHPEMVGLFKKSTERAGIEPARASLPHPTSRRAPSPAVGLPLQCLRGRSLHGVRARGSLPAPERGPYMATLVQDERDDRDDTPARPEHDQSPAAMDAAGWTTRRENFCVANIRPLWEAVLAPPR